MKAQRNYHHLRPRVRGGQDLPHNLLFIKVTRHRAWHTLWGNASLNEIINLLKDLRQDPTLRSFKHSPLWKALWGQKDLSTALAILLRVQRIKKFQRLCLYL